MLFRSAPDAERFFLQRFWQQKVLPFWGIGAIPGSMVIYAISRELRNRHVYDWFTLHNSNFFVGMAFLGTLHAWLSVMFPRRPLLNLLLTAVTGVLGNLMFEVQPFPFAAATDWPDFWSGIAATVITLIYAGVASSLAKRYAKAQTAAD